MCRTHYEVSSLILRVAGVLGMADIDVPDALQSEQFDFESGGSTRDGGHRCAGRTTK